MRGLNSAEVLALWETGLRDHPARRSVRCLAVVDPGSTDDALARLPVGERDARLLELRKRTFGSQLSALAVCPACGELVQADFETGQLCPTTLPVGRPAEVRHDGFCARFRLPDSNDLEAAARAPDVAATRYVLMERCIIEPRASDGAPVAVHELSSAFVAAFSREVAAADPQVEVELALNCPGCRHAWRELFDIAAFFWAELQACARRLLHEVHELAAAYGWTEKEILALTPARRAAYLGWVRK